MSKKMVDRIRELEWQAAFLEGQVRELQARLPIVINNPAPIINVMPASPSPGISPTVAPMPWVSTTCGAAEVGFTGHPPQVLVSY